MASFRCVYVWGSRSYSRRVRAILSSTWTGQSRRLLRVSATTFGTEKELEDAKQRVLTLTQDPGNDAKLQLYGLYKQVGLLVCVMLVIR